MAKFNLNYIATIATLAWTVQRGLTSSCGSAIIFECSEVDAGGFCTPLSRNAFPHQPNATNRSNDFFPESVDFGNKTILTPRIGPRCQSSKSGKECCVDPCTPNPCLNNGICTISQTENERFLCNCPDAFEGDWCQTPALEMPESCRNCDSNAICMKGRCICRIGYVGDGTFCTGRCGEMRVSEGELYHTKCKNLTIHFNSSFEGHTQESNEKCDNRALATIDCKFGTTAYDTSTIICMPCSETIFIGPVAENMSAPAIEERIRNIALLTTGNNVNVTNIQKVTVGLKSLSTALKHNDSACSGKVTKKEISPNALKNVLTIVERLLSDLTPGISVTPTQDAVDKLPEENENDAKIREVTKSVTDLIDDFARTVNMSGTEQVNVVAEKTAVQIIEPTEESMRNHSDIYFRTNSTTKQSASSGMVPRKQPTIEMRIPGRIVGDMHSVIHGEDSTQKLKVVIAAFNDAKHLSNDPRTGPVVEACFRPGACSLDTNFTSNFEIHYQTPPVPTAQQKKVISGKRLILHSEYFCVHWNRVTRSWSQFGCRFINNTDPNSTNLNYTCSCNHFTSFSVLLRVTTELEPYHTYNYCLVLCAISAILLVITVLIYLLTKELRIRRPTPIMVNVCVNLAVGFILFIAGMDGRTRGYDEHSCFIFAVLMHLIFLFAWFWMLIYSLNMYYGLVKVVESSPLVSKKPFMYMFGYAVPAIIVFMDLGISITLDHRPKHIEATSYESHYIASNICWVRGLSMYLGFATPIGCILVVNLIIFVLVMRKLTWKKSTIKSTREKTTASQQMLMAIAMCSTMGLTWIFGYLMFISVDPHYNLIMEVFFNVFNTSQGVVIFFISCLRQDTVRRLWLYPLFRPCGCCTKNKDGASTSAVSGDTTDSGAPAVREKSGMETSAL